MGDETWERYVIETGVIGRETGHQGGSFPGRKLVPQHTGAAIPLPEGATNDADVGRQARLVIEKGPKPVTWPTGEGWEPPYRDGDTMIAVNQECAGVRQTIVEIRLLPTGKRLLSQCGAIDTPDRARCLREAAEWAEQGDA